MELQLEILLFLCLLRSGCLTPGKDLKNTASCFFFLIFFQKEPYLVSLQHSLSGKSPASQNPPSLFLSKFFEVGRQTTPLLGSKNCRFPMGGSNAIEDGDFWIGGLTKITQHVDETSGRIGPHKLKQKAKNSQIFSSFIYFLETLT